MALVIGDNFNYQGQQPNFARDTFNTLEQMKAFPEACIDEGHISLCLATGKRYEYSSKNTVDSTTGKWRLVIDTALDATSENPIQNKVLYNKFNKIQEDLQQTLEEANEEIEEIIEGLKEKISQYDDVVLEGDQVSAKSINEIKDYVESCNRVISAALNDLKINTASLDITVNGHPLKEGNLDLSKSDIGLGNVDNTSDADKPLSNATIIALDDKVDKVEGYGLIGDGDYDKLRALPSSAQLDGLVDDANTNLNNHINDQTNPHNVTMEQLGVDTELDKKVDKTLKVNGHALSEDITIDKSDINLGNVDNTSDESKPVSTKQQEALDEKADEISKAVAYPLTEIYEKLSDLNRTIAISLNEIWKRIIAGGLKDIEGLKRVGTEDEFPEGNIPIGFQYFNTTDESPYWWTGTNWKGLSE